ncbi:MAG: 1,4-alpha-glucan branching protein GlgB [Lentisphaeraceae bacterium]|nr:1,4-alpha-glucan branching protein GlgB [Lentisphaeraceae bacterium]
MSKTTFSKSDIELYFPADLINQILYSNTSCPHSILGKHPIDNEYIYRVFDPVASKVEICIGKKKPQEMIKINENGFYLFKAKAAKNSTYKINRHYDSSVISEYDPYCFLPTAGELDLHLYANGKHQELYNFLGANIITAEEVTGTRFIVWAPNAAKVSLIGNFNSWDGRRNLMRSLGSTGLWEIFMPGLNAGEYYKYEIKDQNGHIFTKQDPIAKAFEKRPGTASAVAPKLSHKWTDKKWISKREKTDTLKQPLSIYEVHLNSWNGPYLPEREGQEFYNYRDLAHALAKYVTELGFTHIELLPVTEHPLDQSWGYQTTGYFAPTSRFGSPDDFAYFVDHLHQNNIGVLIDWAPAHFPKDAFALGRFDGTALYEHLDPRLGEHQDWGTFIFNYGRLEVKNFLIASALYWLKEFHIDGLRVDAVSSMLYLDYSREHDQWVPNEFGGNENLAAIDFIKELNTLSHDKYPGSMIIAEESTAYGKVSKPIFDGGLGYTMKWNMGWMHDFLDYFGNECVHRKYHQNQITFSLTYAFNENFILPLSHDEVVHGKGSLITRMPGDIWQKFANLRCLFGIMFSHPGKKLLFMGGEIAQWREWDSDSSLDWPTLSDPNHKGVQTLISKLNKVYKENPCLWENDHEYSSFEWVDFQDAEQSIVSFVRYNSDKSDSLLCVCNLTPVIRENYKIGVPEKGNWEIIMNSDSHEFNGSDYLKDSSFGTFDEHNHGREQSISISLPPLAVIYLKNR